MGRLAFLDGQSDSPLLRARISFYENGYEGVEAKLKKMAAIISKQAELITGMTVLLGLSNLGVIHPQPGSSLLPSRFFLNPLLHSLVLYLSFLCPLCWSFCAFCSLILVLFFFPPFFFALCSLAAAQRQLGRNFNEELNSFIQLEFSKEDTRADPLLRKVSSPSFPSSFCTDTSPRCLLFLSSHVVLGHPPAAGRPPLHAPPAT